MKLNRYVVFALVALASVFLGYLVATRELIALGLMLMVAFGMLWSFRRWTILIWPITWALLADPVFLEKTHLMGSRMVTVPLDVWTVLALGITFLMILTSRDLWKAFKQPAALGVVVLWLCFIAAQLAGGNPLDSQGYWVSELRALIMTGWLVVAYLICRDSGRDQVGVVMVVVVVLAIVKGMVFLVTGMGILSSGSAGYFRVFGSEEATIGLFAWSIAFSQLTRQARSRGGRKRWVALLIGGAALLLLSALRAYWAAAVAAVVLIWLIGAYTGITGTLKSGLGFMVGAVAVFAALGLLGGNFYSAAIGTRLSTLLGGDATSDASVGYRLMEFGGVLASVGPNWLFGAGLGATHRTVLSIFVTDATLQQTLLRYVHNSFLWAYLKAGIVGVFGVVSYYAGLATGSWRMLRDSVGPEVRAIQLAVFVSVITLIGTDFFNAHVASPRFVVVLGVVLGWAISFPTDTSDLAEA